MMIKSKAFTLIELIVVLAIIGIISVVFIPSMRNMILENRLSSFSNDFVSSVSIAKSGAISNRERVQLSAIENDWSNGWLVTVDSNGNGSFSDSEDEILREVSLGDSLKVVGTPTVMLINSNGVLNGLTWSGITVCDSRDEGRTVSVSGAGITSINKQPSC